MTDSICQNCGVSYIAPKNRFIQSRFCSAKCHYSAPVHVRFINTRKLSRDVTPEVLKEFLRYNPKTGNFFWRPRSEKWFVRRGDCDRWNRDNAGKRAGSLIKSGYLVLSIFHNQIRAHRAAWAIYYGEWPSNEIDHINGIRDDNRIENLRDVVRTKNGRNLCLYRTNTSGHSGVYHNKREGYWYAQIKIKGRNTHLGTFKSKAAAIRARRQAERELGYHHDHGRRQANY